MTPYKHAISSAKKFGGIPMDYAEIHNWFDETKQYTGDWTHRALRHHSAGVEWAIQKFGHAIRVSGANPNGSGKTHSGTAPNGRLWANTNDWRLAT
jgi:hypothetical protein